MNPEVLLENSVEIKRSKRLKGQAVLQGDGLIGFQALLLGALAEGPTRLENLPDTPWFRDVLEDFIRMGYAQQALDGAWTIHGGSAPVTGTEPLRVRHEVELITLAAFLAAKGCKRTLDIDQSCVSADALELLGKILRTEKVSVPAAPTGPILPDHAELEITEPELPGTTEVTSDGESILPGAAPIRNADAKKDSLMLEAPTGILPRAADMCRVQTTAAGLAGSGLGASALGSAKPADMGWDEYQAKLALLPFHLAAGLPMELALAKGGPDSLENLIAHFEGPIKIERNETPGGDELARRIARQMRAAGKQESQTKIRLAAGAKLKPQSYAVPADITQVSAFCLAATLLKGSDLLLEGVPLNPSRAGFISALRRMGADIEVVTRRERNGEALGSLRVRSADLFAKRFGAENLSGMRDEIFLLMVAAAYAEGETVIRDIGHLRRHRKDLLKTFAVALKTAGVEIGEIEDGLVIRGRPDYDGSAYNAQGHPGLALACMVMAMKSHGSSTLAGAECLDGRYPGLLDQMNALAIAEAPKA